MTSPESSYNPTPEELSVAQESMTEEQAEQSLERETAKIRNLTPELQNKKEEYLRYINEGHYLSFELSKASPELLADKDFVFAIVKSRGLDLKYASPELKNDKEVVIEAVMNHGSALKYASPELQADKEVVLAAVRSGNPSALGFASEDLRSDKEFVMELISIPPHTTFEYMSVNLCKDKDILLEILARIPDFLSRSIDVEQHAELFRRHNFQAYHNNHVLLETYYNLRLNNSVEGDSYYDREIKEVLFPRNLERSIEEYKIAGEIMTDDQRLQSYYRAAEQTMTNKQLIQSEIRESIKERGFSGPNGLKPDAWLHKEQVLEAVHQDGQALSMASLEFQGDKQIVLEALKTNGSVLEYASPELRNDKEVVLAAVSQDGSALRYASPELRNDKEVALVAVSQTRYALKYVPPQLQEDKDIIELTFPERQATAPTAPRETIVDTPALDTNESINNTTPEAPWGTVDSLITQIEKYIADVPARGYWHHGRLISDIEEAYKKEGKDITELDIKIPNWRSELERTTKEREERFFGSDWKNK